MNCLYLDRRRAMVDKSIIKRRFAGAFGSYDKSAVVQRAIAADLFSLIEKHIPLPAAGKILEIGCGTGFLTRMISTMVPSDRLLLNDICPESKLCLENIPHTCFLEGDAESLEFPSDLALIASSSVIQWFHDLEGFLAKCHRCLMSGGYMALSTFAPGNLEEVAEISGCALNYLPSDRLKGMIADKFSILCSQETTYVLHFSSPVDVLRHLKQTGVNGTGSRMWTKKDLNDFCIRYMERYGTDEGCTLTYRPLYIIGKKVR